MSCVLFNDITESALVFSENDIFSLLLFITMSFPQSNGTHNMMDFWCFWSIDS